jgi:dihydrofolate reductase
VAKLIYAAITSLDGYVADQHGNFDWAAPDAEVHSFVNELERPIGTHLFGRRMYDVMLYWEAAPAPSEPPHIQEYRRIWQAADKIVYSKTLEAPSSGRTRIERQFDPKAIVAMKATLSSDISVGGPNLGAHAIKAGLVDEYHLFLTPVVVGGGTRALPEDVLLPLELQGEHRFTSGVVHLHYRTKT